MNNITYNGPKGGGVEANVLSEDLTNRLFRTENTYLSTADDYIREVDPDTLLDIRSFVAPTKDVQGVGGMANRLFCSTFSGYNLHELDPITGVVINSNDAFSIGQPSGIGGIASRLYYCDYSGDDLEELDPDTLINISSRSSYSTEPRGIGGMSSRLYYCDNGNDTIYELDPDTKNSINSVAAPTDFAGGIGGIATRLYFCTYSSSRIYELDPDTMLSVGSRATERSYGVGGMKTASVEYNILDIPNLIDGKTEFVAIQYNSEKYKK